MSLLDLFILLLAIVVWIVAHPVAFPIYLLGVVFVLMVARLARGEKL
jgi:hypothetical protein